jgi:N-acetylglucosamine-6-phosphate deacetylase
MAQVVRFMGGDVCSDSGVLEKGDVWVRGGTIIDPMKLFYEEKRAPDMTIDCRGLIVTPGFIDIQINGELHAMHSQDQKAYLRQLKRATSGNFYASLE